MINEFEYGPHDCHEKTYKLKEGNSIYTVCNVCGKIVGFEVATFDKKEEEES